MAIPARKIPSPADQPLLTARSLLRRIAKGGGRILRMRELCVFVITENADLAQWLLQQGGAPYLPRHATRTDVPPFGSYLDAPGGRPKWDIYIHTIPVLGEESVWEAAGRRDDVELYEVEGIE